MANPLEPQLETPQAKQLFKVLASFKQSDEVARFLRDLLTYEELEEIIRRFEVAKMLTSDKKFREIAQATNMSSATIARVNYWLHHSTGGYRLALKKLSEK